jgi:signal transduction histidine kinase
VEEGYLAQARITWADEEHGRGTAGEAMRTGRVAVANDIATDPRYRPWRAAALARGYASNAVLPLVYDGERLGIIGAFSGERNAFDDGVIEVLQRVADDLAFGLVALRTRAASERSAEELVRSSRLLRALAARVQRVREDEKARIARDLHDDLGQLLTALQLELRGAEQAAEGLPADERAGRVLDRLVAASELAATTVETVQRLSLNLRPEALERLGLDAALRQELRLFERRTGLEVALRLEPVPGLDAEPATAAFRIAQEALTNVARHAQARRVEVRLAKAGDAAVLEVADDGRGLPPDRPDAERLGLLGMEERAREFGGEVTLSERPGGGTCVQLRIPLRRAPADERPAQPASPGP